MPKSVLGTGSIDESRFGEKPLAKNLNIWPDAAIFKIVARARGTTHHSRAPKAASDAIRADQPAWDSEICEISGLFRRMSIFAAIASNCGELRGKVHSGAIRWASENTASPKRSMLS